MKAILLTKEQADKVRGRHGKYSELQPVETKEGSFVLPIEVLDDPEHAEVLNELGICKYTEVDINQEINEKMPEGDLLRETQVISVKEVSPVTITVEKAMGVKPTYEKVIIK